MLYRAALCCCGMVLLCIDSPVASAQKQPSGAGDAAVLFQQGQALAAEGRLAEAEAPLSSAVALAPQDAQMLTLLAKVKSRLGESKDAVALFRQVTVEQSRSATAHFNLAIALADAGDTKGALAEVEAVIRLEPRNAQAHLNRARMLADAGRVAEARAEFLRAEQLAPGDGETAFFRAMFEQDNHRPQIAAPLFAKVVAQQPKNEQAYFRMGQALADLNQEDAAIAAWRRAIALDPSAQDAVYALYQALREKDPPQAAQLLERFNQLRAEKQKTEQALALGNQAYAAMQQQSWAAAVGLLQQAVEACGGCSLQAGLHRQLGLAECHNGDLDGGERELRVAISLDPNDRTAVEALQQVAEQRERGGAAH